MVTAIDLTGQSFGEWKVVAYAESSRYGARWLCVCSCGVERVVGGVQLRRGHSSCCGVGVHSKGWRSRLVGAEANVTFVLRLGPVVWDWSGETGVWRCEECDARGQSNVDVGDLAREHALVVHGIQGRAEWVSGR